MSNPSPSQTPPAHGPQHPPQRRSRRGPRPGYLASLISLAAALVMVGVVAIVGIRIGHPQPEFIAEVSGGEDVEIEVAEDEPLGEVVLITQGFAGACVQYTPEPDLEMGDLRSTGTHVYGPDGMEARDIYVLDEPGTHTFQCTDDAEGGLAPVATTVDAAQTRQVVWVVTFLGVITVGVLLAIGLALATFLRSRKETAARLPRH
ncbi:hypothetical protein [Nocardiopsis kunsanensis]|uniref:hypothetical protein n=1 Tax=Nocardiopsis kunsanensis TaxID=141693 RepID=UPI00037FB592|nr:hypothetical protein [Nocardiopsis kunsanensis]